MGDADEREEILVLTREWNEPALEMYLRAYDHRRAQGATHEQALVRALGDVLP